MKIVNMSFVPGYDIYESLGLIEANTIQAKHIGQDILSGLRQLVGGHLSEYEDMMLKARESAKADLIKQAQELGADAIINVRYSTSAIMQGAAEILIYGTAVKIKKQ